MDEPDSYPDFVASSCKWQAYTWKNELSKQARRTFEALSEALDQNFEGDDSPLHMLERSIALAAFSIRRMTEKGLITDNLKGLKCDVLFFQSKDAFRPPFWSGSN